MTKTSGECGFREKQRSGGSGGGREVDSGGCRGDGRWRWTGKNRDQMLMFPSKMFSGINDVKMLHID
ncbi:hypothetical protein RJT34_04229 [Clitoria ternatea]|uniref:Uncharacterized protein n=1 Tax=Clitoria ternatea TaxID=43366 RepID=A0AAN9KNQ6_CLITE